MFVNCKWKGSDTNHYLLEKTREWSSEISFLKISELKYSGKDHDFNYGIINAPPSFCNRIVDKMTENKSQERVQVVYQSL